MPREEYQTELDDLQTKVYEMGMGVVERLDQSLHALRTDDERLAREAIEGDVEINQLYLDLESTCVDLFALQQPVAGDLRFVTASFKIITDLERIGDLAANLAEYSLSADADRLSEIDVYGIGNDARSMVEDALEAYESADVDACGRIAARDDDLDALCQRASEQVVRDLIERKVDDDESWAIESLMDDGSRILLTVRDIERVGDHAVNIAARTLYMAENDPELIY